MNIEKHWGKSIKSLVTEIHETPFVEWLESVGIFKRVLLLVIQQWTCPARTVYCMEEHLWVRQMDQVEWR